VLEGLPMRQYDAPMTQSNHGERSNMTGPSSTLKKILLSTFLLALSWGQNLLAADEVKVVMTTSMGTIELELYPDKAPISVENFVNYANSGFYDGTIFHRVIGNFMIQGGGFTPDMQKKPTREPIKNEAANGLSNRRGTIAMARLPQPDTATSQFFINVQNNMNLDYQGANNMGYAVFGKVTRGMDVVDDIRFVQTGNRGPMGDVPVEPVIIESVEVISD
jgi:cyclophilin family peptidyl-prolyl cis-trans isomerase